MLGGGRENTFAMEKDIAAIWLIKSGNEAQQCRFSTARRPKQGKELPRLDMQRHLIQGQKVIKVARDSNYFQQRGDLHSSRERLFRFSDKLET